MPDPIHYGPVEVDTVLISEGTVTAARGNMPQRANRRDLLADAAIEVLAREGGRGLTHRAVDRDAQVPEGTTKNYYPSRESLFVAVAGRMTDLHTAAVRQLRDQTPQGVTRDDLAALYTAMLTRVGSSARSRFLALLELHLEGVRRPEVRAALGRMALANVDSAVHLHASAGVDLPRQGAGLLDAGMVGVAVSLLSLPEDVVRTIGFDDAAELSSSLLTAARSSQAHGESSAEAVAI